MIEFEQAYETIPGNGWLTKAEAELLWNVAKDQKGPILEVGCYMGRSTCLLAQLGRPVYCVDPFENFSSEDPSGKSTREVFEQNLKERNIANVTLFPIRVEDWSGLDIGFAYLDGDHTYEGTLQQIFAAVNCGVKSFCIHDYPSLDVQRAVQEAGVKVIQVVERMAYCVHL